MPAYRDERTGTWYSSFRYKDWTGQTKGKKKRGFKTRREALKYEMEFKARQEGDLEMGFSEFVDIYKKERFPRLKETTCVSKENIIDTKILPYFGKKKLCEIDTADIVKWQNALLEYKDPYTGKPYSGSYLKTVHAQLSAIFNYACRFYKLKNNPASLAGGIGNENDKRVNFWTMEEYKKFSEEMMKTPKAYYAFQILYWLGLREGEMLALSKSDFDFEKKTVSITKNFQHVNGKDIITSPKTPMSIRKVIIPDFLCEELRDYFKKLNNVGNDDRLFEPMTKHYLQKKLKEGAMKAGVKKIRVHDLRHSHVSLLINMGYRAVEIAPRMGHESIHITYRYAHLFPTVQTDMAKELNRLQEED